MDWYENHSQGDPVAVGEMERFARELIPQMVPVNTLGGCCVTANVSIISTENISH